MMRKMLYAAIATMVLAAPAAAQMNCGAMLDKYSADIGKMANVSSEKRAAMHRMVLQGYDHCMAGDEFNAKKFFEMLEKDRR
jgi:hypothetical protein